jgi:hypothetical protein
MKPCRAHDEARIGHRQGIDDRPSGKPAAMVSDRTLIPMGRAKPATQANGGITDAVRAPEHATGDTR